MIEMLFNPKKVERMPWEMFFVGLLYSSVSLLLVNYVFGEDVILREGSGLLVVLFSVICSMPFMYFIIKNEEEKDIEISKSGKLIKEHAKALNALIWLFLGITVAFSFWYVILPNDAGKNFNFQIKTFCAINRPGQFDKCVSQYGVPVGTGAVSKSTSHMLAIFSNNIYVLIFTLLFSLAFGAGAIFILVWNASVIGAAMGIFAKQSIAALPLSFLRYMIHGIPEIGAYFIGSLAGGIISVAVIRRDMKGERLWIILQDALVLTIIAIAVLFVAALVEVYVTPILF
ncbi:stage II sporulation protein M [Candidatus Pacearchaeota archaeon]|nr:MAG: stage II sporulation protein M [Candidatus Pacearchaeota archaeon]